MTIKHLVISGGGPIGIMYLGAIEYLHDEGFFKMEEIESIYATSIGTMIAVFIALNYDWETLRKEIKYYGVRNSLCVAPMPTASKSQ